MSGIDNMTNQIMEQANLQANDILKQAKEEESKILDALKLDLENIKQESDKKLESEIKDYKSRALSSRDLTKRRKILQTKQDIIADLIDKTCLSLKELNKDEYFNLLIQIFKKFAYNKQGIMYLNKKDLDRMDKSFENDIEKIAKEKGGEIEISKTPKEIEDGFLLVYGGVEENCSFNSLVMSNKSKLQDRINEMLWRSHNEG